MSRHLVRMSTEGKNAVRIAVKGRSNKLSFFGFSLGGGAFLFSRV